MKTCHDCNSGIPDGFFYVIQGSQGCAWKFEGCVRYMCTIKSLNRNSGANENVESVTRQESFSSVSR